MTNVDPSITQTSVHLTVSPALYGIALRPDQPQQLRAAVQLACKWWGGIRFPMLEVAADGSVIESASTMCNELDIVGIIDLTRSTEAEPAAAGVSALTENIVVGDNPPPLAMPVRGIVTPSAEHAIMRASCDTDGDFDPLAMFNLGLIDDDECAAWENLGQGVATNNNDSWLYSQPGQRTALGITSTADDNFVITSAFITSAALIWVLPDEFTVADVAKDLLAFWNYRALRIRHKETVTVLTRLSSLYQPEVQRNLIKAISATAVTTPMCVLNGLAVGKEELSRVAQLLGFKVLPNQTTLTDRHFKGGDPVELTALVNFNLAGHWIGDRFTGTGVDVLAVTDSPSWQVRIDSPLSWHYPDALQGLVSIRISSPAIRGPHTDSVARLFHANARWKAGGVQVFERATPVYRRTIGSPHPSEVLTAALADANARFKASDKGREINGVIAATSNLQLFRTPAFHAITSVLTPQPSPRVEHALESLAVEINSTPETVDLAEELRAITALAKPRRFTLQDLVNYPSVRAAGIKRDAISSVLTEMVAHGLGRWGFERHCALCGLSELVPLPAVSPVPKCTGCGRDAAFTERNGEPVLYYGLTSLLERVGRNAGLTPLAAAAALRQMGYYLIAGADIFQGDIKSETDLLGWNSDRLLIGEAKAAAALFTTSGIIEDIKTAADLGATTYLLACPESLDAKIIRAAVEAGVNRGVEILQLTGSHLASKMPPTYCVVEAPVVSADEE